MSAIYDDWGETEQALLIAERSTTAREKMGLTELLPSSLLQLALVYTNLGRFEDAERCFRGVSTTCGNTTATASASLRTRCS